MRPSIRLFLLLTIPMAYPALDLAASELKQDESVIFIPGWAHSAEDGAIRVNVHAWVYEKERRPGLTAALARYLDIDRNSLSEEQRLRFQDRTQLFRVDSERGKTITVRFADGTEHRLPPTGPAGRTDAQITVSGSLRDGNSPIRFIVSDDRDTPVASGVAWFISDQGISIVSDIDDTIKDSQVLDPKTLLRNTFLEPFKPVAGMADWYTVLANSTPDAAFHYLSSSPIQLYPLLQYFLDDYGFPGGSTHLRESTTWRTIIPYGDASRQHKQTVLSNLLAAFPNRRYILIGDSGEADPEIYADIARAHPERIKAIYIRNVTDQPRSASRYRNTFADLPDTLWHVFQTVPPSISDTPEAEN